MQQITFGLMLASITTVTLLQQPIIAQVMPEKPEGYFAHRGTVYAKSGGSICGFTSSGHYEIYRRAKGGRDLNISDISTYKKAGNCPSTKAFFSYKRSGFYSFGDGNFCGFSDPGIQNEYRQRFDAPLVGEISTHPNLSMKYLGRCKELP